MPPPGGQAFVKASAEALLGELETQTHLISMKIDLPPETAASLAARAAAEGISLLEYVVRRLREDVAQDTANTLSPSERAAAWREAAKGLPRTPPLSDEAISREGIYGARGQVSVLVDTNASCAVLSQIINITLLQS